MGFELVGEILIVLFLGAGDDHESRCDLSKDQPVKENQISKCSGQEERSEIEQCRREGNLATKS